MKVAIYGGSFDPIHIGHINLALEMTEAHQLDEIWFCPAALNPHKRGHSANAKNRLDMLRLATAPVPHFKVIENELKRPPPSYTIDTLQELQQENLQNNLQLHLIIGEDAAPHFYQWYQAEAIIEKATLLVGRRGHENLDAKLAETPSKIRQAIEAGMTSSRIIDVSSSEIRKRLLQNLYCGHLLHLKVLDYILSHDLYS